MKQPAPDAAKSSLPDATPRIPASFTERMIIALVCVVVVVCMAAMWKRDVLRAYWLVAQIRNRVDDRGNDVSYRMRLAGIGGNAVPAIGTLLHHEDPNLREIAVEVLVAIDDDQARDMLCRALADSDSVVRDLATHGLALGKSNDALVETLMTIIRDGMEPATSSAVVALGRMAMPQVPQILSEIAETHTDPNVRAQAVQIIGLRMLESCRATLTKISETDHAEVTATLYLQRLGDRVLQYTNSGDDGWMQALEDDNAEGFDASTLKQPTTVSETALWAIHQLELEPLTPVATPPEGD